MLNSSTKKSNKTIELRHAFRFKFLKREEVIHEAIYELRITKREKTKEIARHRAKAKK